VAVYPKTSAKLERGARIAVIGGGPAGSAFAMFALHFARQLDTDVQVTIFEPRDFSRPGPRGCNMCAGLIPVRALHPLRDIGVSVPRNVIRQRIGQYTLHTAAGTIPLSQPDPDADVISVYRGSGPLESPLGPGQSGFDGFMLETARSRGAEIVAERVTSVGLDGGPRVRTEHETFAADLVVLAAGINRSTVAFDDLDYRPPPKRQMAQCEICFGADGVRAALGGSVHIVLARHERLSFGTLIPKGHCINVSLLGDDLPRGSIDRFLALPEVASMLPATVIRACSCRPRVAVGPASPLYADGFVAVGDAGVTRLYKNGIGSAVHTARQAALAAVRHGIDAASFRAHYAPLCREIVNDNRAGRFLFSFSRIFRESRPLALPHLHAVIAEQSLPPHRRRHSRLLWSMFTGAYPYRRLLAMAAHPAVQLRLLRGAARGLLRRPIPRDRTDRPAPVERLPLVGDAVEDA
jgi:flavin-dependent dehydrogenase